MSSLMRWRDTGHLDRVTRTADRPAEAELLSEPSRAWRLEELRKRRELTQEQVAQRMGVTVAWVDRVESGDVPSQDCVTSYVAALGGTVRMIADFGDEQLRLN